MIRVYLSLYQLPQLMRWPCTDQCPRRSPSTEKTSWDVSYSPWHKHSSHGQWILQYLNDYTKPNTKYIIESFSSSEAMFWGDSGVYICFTLKGTHNTGELLVPYQPDCFPSTVSFFTITLNILVFCPKHKKNIYTNECLRILGPASEEWMKCKLCFSY